MGRITCSASPTLLKDGASIGDHGVVVETLASSGPSGTWYSTEAEARSEFNERVRRLQEDQNGPSIARIRLVEQGDPIDEEFIVRRISTYL